MLKKSIEEYCWEAMVQLLGEKPYNKISVRDIARRVGISTAAFYKYFNSKSDLYYRQVYKSGTESYSRLGESYTWFNYLYDNLLINVDNAHEITNITIYAEENESLLELLFRSNTELMNRYITEHYGADVLGPELQTAIHVYLYGLLIYMEKDIRSGMVPDRRKTAEYLTNCMPEILKKYIPHSFD